MQINPYLGSLHSTPHTTYRVSDGPLSSSSSEIGNIAQGVGQVIQDYNNKIHDSLEDWHKLNVELSDFLKFAKPLAQLLITLNKISAGSDNVVIEGKEAALFLELGHLLGDNYTNNVHITGISFTEPDGGIWTLDPSTGGEQLYYVYQQTANIPLKDCTNIKITLSPSDAQGTEKELSTSLSKDGYNFGSLSGISQTVSSLKNKQTRDLFKVMSLSNAKKSNEKTLSSIFQILKSITSTALSNMQ